MNDESYPLISEQTSVGEHTDLLLVHGAKLFDPSKQKVETCK